MILAFDSATSGTSVALVSGDEVVREIKVDSPRGRGSGLFSALEEVLTGGVALERVVVGTGPGSYNGIRGALAAGWGIAAARGIPLVGVSSLLALGTGSYIAIGDARRAQFYWAVVENSAFIEEPCLLEAAELSDRLSAAPGYVRFTPTAIQDVPDAEIQRPSAVLLARVGAELSPSVGIPEPIYLKPAYINLPKVN